MFVKALSAAFVALLSAQAMAGGAALLSSGGGFWQGFNEGTCRSQQKQADEAAIAAGRSPVLLGCMQEMIEERRAERDRVERRRDRLVCTERWGRVVCERED